MKERNIIKAGMIPVLGLAFLVSIAGAEIPRVISYQGRISDGEGNPVADGTYNMRFRLFDAETGGNLEWDSGLQSIALDGGIFNVLLGDAGQPALDMEFAEEYWLVVTFDGVNQLPRQRLTSVGYAYMASGIVPGTEMIDSRNNPIFKGTNLGTGAGLRGDSDSGIGVRGESNYQYGTGVYGVANHTGGYENYGVYGESASSSGCGVYGVATAESGSNYGVVGRSYSNDGFGVIGVNYEEDGSGVYGYSTEGNGVKGYSWPESDGVGVYYSNGLAGSGNKSCVVKTSRGPTLMYCQESPENWFEDFGEGQLVNGRCRVELDPLYLETVTIDDENPMKVFVQPKSFDCKGLALVPGSTGFDVGELLSGESDSPFTYRVVAKRRGFEEERLDYCKAAETDPYLYEEMREKMIREDLEERARFEEARKEYGMKRGSDPESFSRSE